MRVEAIRRTRDVRAVVNVRRRGIGQRRRRGRRVDRRRRIVVEYVEVSVRVLIRRETGEQFLVDVAHEEWKVVRCGSRTIGMRSSGHPGERIGEVR